MPLYYFACEKCGLELRRILSVEESKAPGPCSCGGGVKRTPRPPTARVTEVIDNGVMTKRLERLADAERLFSERNAITKKNRGL